MRTLRDLVADRDKVWIYLENDSEKEAFAARCRDEGFHFHGGNAVNADCCGYAMALHHDLTLGNLALIVWTKSFEPGAINVPLRVEYGKYFRNAEDYECRESHFRRVLCEKEMP